MNSSPIAGIVIRNHFDLALDPKHVGKRCEELNNQTKTSSVVLIEEIFVMKVSGWRKEDTFVLKCVPHVTPGVPA